MLGQAYVLSCLTTTRFLRRQDGIRGIKRLAETRISPSKSGHARDRAEPMLVQTVLRGDAVTTFHSQERMLEPDVAKFDADGQRMPKW